MLLRDLKKDMFSPEKEIFINKIVKIREIDVLLISITLEEYRNVLWAMYQLPCYLDVGIDLGERRKHRSNRDEMINNFSNAMSSDNIPISEIMIQKQKMTFASSSASRMYDINYKKYMQLQHFIEIGMVTSKWNDVDLDNIVIAAYEQEENEEFAEIDLSMDLDITLKISKDLKQVLINQPIRMGFGEMGKGNKFYFYDYIEEKNRIFYINKMMHYDIWEEINHNLEHERIQSLPKEQIKKIKEQYMDSLDKVCPKGMNLAILEYETEDNVKLNFYSKEYLDEKAVHKTSSTSMMYFELGKDIGSNGFESRVCVIKPVEKDFNDSIDVELFSWFMQIPEEIMKV